MVLSLPPYATYLPFDDIDDEKTGALKSVTAPMHYQEGISALLFLTMRSFVPFYRHDRISSARLLRLHQKPKYISLAFQESSLIH